MTWNEIQDRRNQIELWAKIKMQTEQDTPNPQKAERIKLGAEVNEIMSLIWTKIAPIQIYIDLLLNRSKQQLVRVFPWLTWCKYICFA